MYVEQVPFLSHCILITMRRHWQREKFFIDKDILAKHFQDQNQKPFFSEIKKEAEKTMESVIARSSRLAQKIVNESLQEEQARFDREVSLKRLSVQDTISLAIDTTSAFWNLAAAANGLNELQTCLDKVLQKSLISVSLK